MIVKIRNINQARNQVGIILFLLHFFYSSAWNEVSRGIRGFRLFDLESNYAIRSRGFSRESGYTKKKRRGRVGRVFFQPSRVSIVSGTKGANGWRRHVEESIVPLQDRAKDIASQKFHLLQVTLQSGVDRTSGGGILPLACSPRIFVRINVSINVHSFFFPCAVTRKWIILIRRWIFGALEIYDFSRGS